MDAYADQLDALMRRLMSEGSSEAEALADATMILRLQQPESERERQQRYARMARLGAKRA